MVRSSVTAKHRSADASWSLFIMKMACFMVRVTSSSSLVDGIKAEHVVDQVTRVSSKAGSGTANLLRWRLRSSSPRMLGMVDCRDERIEHLVATEFLGGCAAVNAGFLGRPRAARCCVGKPARWKPARGPGRDGQIEPGGYEMPRQGVVQLAGSAAVLRRVSPRSSTGS